MNPEVKAELERLSNQFRFRLAERLCVKCEELVVEYQQDGRCVYAAPCGHRQYQGQLMKETAHG